MSKCYSVLPHQVKFQSQDLTLFFISEKEKHQKDFSLLDINSVTFIISKDSRSRRIHRTSAELEVQCLQALMKTPG